MSDNVEDAVPQILRKIQQDIAEFRAAVDARFDKVDARFALVDEAMRKQRRDTAGLLVMAKSMSGSFAEDLAAIEERVAALESRDALR